MGAHREREEGRGGIQVAADRAHRTSQVQHVLPQHRIVPLRTRHGPS